MRFRPFQQTFKDDIIEQWKHHRHVLGVLPTGGGKTVVFSNIVANHQGVACVIAHRQELVSQISLALNRNGVKHKIVAPKEVIKNCVNLHMAECGTSHFQPNAQTAVAGVDTLIRRNDLNDWCKSVSLWVTDEAHHLLSDNKWGKAAAMFPNAKGLGVTATPTRADGRGLGEVFETMVEGPTMRELINQGYLTDYRIFAPPSDLDLTDVNVAAGGDYNPNKLKRAVQRSHVIGDVVTHYRQFAMGEAGITFASDVESANDIADSFNAQGVPSVAVSANTPDHLRIKYLNQLKHGDLLNIVNVDLFGEGVDIPAIKVVSFARPTQSYGLFIQQCGRALRLLNPPSNWDEFTDIERLLQIKLGAKPHAKIIDHVGNIIQRHGLPDIKREWTLAARERKNRKPLDEVPIRTCVECFAVYERILPKCPFCETAPIPASRSTPEAVDGDLLELDEATLTRMRGGIAAIDLNAEEYRDICISKHMPQIGVLAAMKRHRIDQETQVMLRDSIALWAGHRRAEGMPDSEIYKRFYFAFGIDIMSAQALKSKDGMTLTENICGQLR